MSTPLTLKYWWLSLNERNETERMITKSEWEKGSVEFYDPILGDFHINFCLPLEWQLEELEAYAECSGCGLENDCQECIYFEHSLLCDLM